MIPMLFSVPTGLFKLFLALLFPFLLRFKSLIVDMLFNKPEASAAKPYGLDFASGKQQ